MKSQRNVIKIHDGHIVPIRVRCLFLEASQSISARGNAGFLGKSIVDLCLLSEHQYKISPGLNFNPKM